MSASISGAHARACTTGSAYIYGFCDKFWRPDMSESEAKEFVVRALSHAMARDASSGGCIRTVRGAVPWSAGLARPEILS